LISSVVISAVASCGALSAVTGGAKKNIKENIPNPSSNFFNCFHLLLRQKKTLILGLFAFLSRAVAGGIFGLKASDFSWFFYLLLSFFYAGRSFPAKKVLTYLITRSMIKI
jgi:hypothetical protein